MKTNHSNITIHLENGPLNKLQLTFWKSGRRLSPFSTEIPAELRSIARKTVSYQPIEYDLKQYFAIHDPELPFFVKYGTEWQPVYWDKTLNPVRKTELRLEEGVFKVEKVAFSDTTSIRRFLLLGQYLIADLENNRLGIWQENPGWELWEYLWLHKKEAAQEKFPDTSKRKYKKEDGEPKTNSLTFFPDELNHYLQEIVLTQGPITLANPDRHYFNLHHIVMDENMVQPAIRYQLAVYPSEEKSQFYIRPEIHFDGHSLFPQSLLQKFYASSVSEWPILSGETIKRRLADIISALLANPDTEAEALEAVRALPEESPSVSHVKQAALDFFHRFTALLKSNLMYLRCGSRHWYLIKADQVKEAFLYQILYDIFGADYFDKNIDSAIRVPRDLFFVKNKALYQRARDEDVALVFEQKPIRLIDLDVSVELMNEGSSFSLMPLIKSNGDTVTENVWRQWLENAGLTDNGEAIDMLDENSRKILQTILSLQAVRAPKRKEDVDEQLESRLKILDWLLLRKLGVKINIGGEEEHIYNRLLGFQEVHKHDLPKKFNGTLRQYQQDGYNWLLFLYESRFGACLADDMGLGKTVQTIAFLGALKEGLTTQRATTGYGPHLIVVPPSLAFNWFNEIRKFYPDFKVARTSRETLQTDMETADIVIITYDLVRRHSKTLSDYHFHVVIFDEAQLVKTAAANRTKAVRRLKAVFKCCLTGTPMENHLGEYYTIMELAVPGLFGSYGPQLHQISDNDQKDILMRRSRPFILRRTKEVIAEELPPKVESDIRFEMTSLQKKLYNEIIVSTRQSMHTDKESGAFQNNKIKILAAILRLRQLCISPALINDHFDPESPKIDYIAQTLSELREEGHSALVYSQFLKSLDILEEKLKQTNALYFRLDGATPLLKREELIQSFTESEEPAVFLISLKAGGFGLNLTKASYVFHLDPWWNPAVENQASDRIYRIGQHQKVFVQKLIMQNSIEEKIMLLKEDKQELFHNVVSVGTREKNSSVLTFEDFQYLLS